MRGFLQLFLLVCILFSGTLQVLGELLIIQLIPDVNFNKFLSLYPSLKYKVSGNITIGSFKAIYGDFDLRFSRYLSYSNMVG